MREHFIEAVVKTAPAASPGIATIALSWGGVIETGLSIVLLTLSIGFLIYRWRVAVQRDRNDG